MQGVRGRRRAVERVGVVFLLFLFFGRLILIVSRMVVSWNGSARGPRF